MSEPALRQLDRGLPRLTMYRTDRLLAAVQPKPAPEPVRKPRDPARELRLLLAEARADREAAARLLAEARVHAQTIIAEAKARAGAVPDDAALPSVADIQRQVAERHGFSVATLLGPGRSELLVVARYEAIRLVHAARPELSSASLGRLFRRDHTIILRALKKARAR